MKICLIAPHTIKGWNFYDKSQELHTPVHCTVYKPMVFAESDKPHNKSGHLLKFVGCLKAQATKKNNCKFKGAFYYN